MSTRTRIAILGFVVCLTPVPALGQTIEQIGTRALGMAGAFVGVADDATAVYWNPAGLATGASVGGVFEIGRADVLTDKNAAVDAASVASRFSTRMVATTATSFGVSTYRIAHTEIVPAGSRSALAKDSVVFAIPVLQRLSASNYGVTLLQTVAEGVVVGGTFRLIRGTAFSGAAPAAGTVDEALDSAENLPSRTSTAFDLDFGAMLVFGSARAGLLVRNIREPEFRLPGSAGVGLALQRHARVGLAITPGRGAHAPGASTNIGLDFDLTRMETPRGRQRDFSVGAEQWLFARHIGVRGGLRVNTLDKAQRATAVGLSFGLGKGSYVDAQTTRGRVADDRSWSVSARVTF